MTGVGRLRPDVKERWVAALRSGDYEQGTHQLGYVAADGATRYCCLGVLCDLAKKDGVVHSRVLDPTVDAPERDFGDKQAIFVYDGADTLPAYAVVDWAYDEPPDVEDPWNVVLTSDEDSDSWSKVYGLADLNDDQGWGFDQIADAIERSL